MQLPLQVLFIDPNEAVINRKTREMVQAIKSDNTQSAVGACCSRVHTINRPASSEYDVTVTHALPWRNYLLEEKITLYTQEVSFQTHGDTVKFIFVLGVQHLEADVWRELESCHDVIVSAY